MVFISLLYRVAVGIHASVGLVQLGHDASPAEGCGATLSGMLDGTPLQPGWLTFHDWSGSRPNFSGLALVLPGLNPNQCAWADLLLSGLNPIRAEQ